MPLFLIERNFAEEINLNSEDRDITELLIMNYPDPHQCGTFGASGVHC